MAGGRLTAVFSILLVIGAVLLAKFQEITLDDARTYLADVIAPQKDIASPNTVSPRSSLVNSKAEESLCGPVEYTTELLNMDPLIIYINNFLSPKEVEGLLKAGEKLFQDSTVADDPSNRYQHPSRTSSTAYLPADNVYVQCAMAKARSFLGFYDFDGIEVPQLTKYAASQQYRAHYDWPDDPWREPSNGNLRFDRFATFFVYLEANCTGGSTHFPHVHIDDIPHLDTLNGTKYEAIVDEKDAANTGDESAKNKSLAVKAIAGNAVFWVNMKGRGRGHRATLHAGMPVIEGTKVGLNLWSRRYLADDEDIGDGSSAPAA